MRALPFKLNSTDCTHGHCPYSYIPKSGCYSPPAGTASGNAAPGKGRMQSVPGYKTLAAQQVEILQRCWVSPSCLSCTWLPRRKLSQAFPSVSSSAHYGFLGEGHLYQVQCPTAWPQALSAHLPVGALNGPGPHSLFLWLKGRNHRERTFSTSFSIPLKWRQGWPSWAG